VPEALMLLEVKNLSKNYRVAKGGMLRRTADVLKAVDDVSFQIEAGETLGLVGESGSGKSTIGQMLLLQTSQSAGTILFEGESMAVLQRSFRKNLMGKIQVVFQDPYDSLNPKMRVADIVAEPLRNLRRNSAREVDEIVANVIEKVGLRREDLRKFPHQFSGGQRQRIGIARAISVNPKFIVLDEPVSALDVSVQAQIINLLVEIQREFQIAYLFISHNLAIVEHVANRVAVLYLGKIVEVLNSRDLSLKAVHPYTRALIDAIPVPDPMDVKADAVLKGEIPSAMQLPPGCRFNSRCEHAQQRCFDEEPLLDDLGDGHQVACHRHLFLRQA
jgi:oligopeptide/dipeptide ABC transporter ATP-binding protein